MLVASALLATAGPLAPAWASVADRPSGIGVGSGPGALQALVQPGNGPSGGVPPVSPDQAVSADGRWVAFASDATDLVDDDTNEARDMFLRDLGAGRTIRIPWLNGTQLPSDLQAGQPTIDAHGEVVAFTVRQVGTPSRASAGLEFPVIAIYEQATTTLLEVNGTIINGTQPSISGDGRTLAYASVGEFGPRVVLVDRGGGAARIISSEAATTGDDPAVSEDGRFVAFTAPATVVGSSGTSDRAPEVYRFDIANGELLRVSALPGGVEPNGASFGPSISADGRFVAFASTATDLADASGLDGTSQVYLWEEGNDWIRLLSSDGTGAAGRGASLAPSISGSGRFVAFQSAAPDLGPITALPASGEPSPSVGRLGTRRATAVFVRDAVNGRIVEASVDAGGRTTPGDSGRPSISGDGMVVVYDSTSPSLIEGDTNDARDVFFRIWTRGASVVPDPLDLGSVLVGGDPRVGVVTVVGTGWAPFEVLGAAITGPNAGDFALRTNDCAHAILYFGDSCPLEIAFSPTDLGSRDARVMVEDSAPGSPHSVRLSGSGTATEPTPTPTPGPSVTAAPGPGGRPGGPGVPPSLVLDPPLGPPGFVTTAIGSGFPAGAKVRLRWDQGINAAADVVEADTDGSFRVGVLVFPKSASGPRVLVATSAGGPSFDETKADFLVVTGSAQPPASGAVTFVSPEVHPIILR